MTRTIKITVPLGVVVLLVILSTFIYREVKFHNLEKLNGLQPYSVQTFKINDGWGYSVYLKKKEIIRQEMIPAITSQKAFYSSDDAAKTATMVVKKLKQKKIPKLSREELKLSGIQIQ